MKTYNSPSWLPMIYERGTCWPIEMWTGRPLKNIIRWCGMLLLRRATLRTSRGLLMSENKRLRFLLQQWVDAYEQTTSPSFHERLRLNRESNDALNAEVPR